MKLTRMQGKESLHTVAMLIARTAAASIPAAALSTAWHLRIGPKTELPIMQEAIKQENTFPKGTSAPGSVPIKAGGHCKTNTYIAPSNRA
mmetsp:Transcript_93522/g.273848  ORF Transcript_93522/g.273848 Transcript_93522/m.273848 type:complete len:90 (+) Transcript_93522:238-507(+)